MHINVSKLKIEDDGIYCPQQVLSELFSLATPQISQLTTAGILDAAPAGRNNLFICVNKYVKYLRGKADLRGSGGSGDFADEKARLTNAQADMAEMEAEEMAGLLVRKDAVVQEWQGILMDMKAKLMAIPTKAATLVADEDNPSNCQEILDGLVREALQELSDYGSKKSTTFGNGSAETAPEAQDI